MKDSGIIGHDGFRYKVFADWGALSAEKFPVKDCHEMVMDSNKQLYLLTNHIANNILVYSKEGKLCRSWGNTYPGAHGLTIANENGAEFLFITDCERHQVIKTTLAGEEVMILNYPKETGKYNGAEEYKPTETAIAPNGDIYIADGYGLQYVIQYNYRGEYIRHWGGKGENEDQFDCVHGIAVDARNDRDLTLLITSRNQNAWKRFTTDGVYISTIYLPGSFVCRPVIHDKNIYGAIFRSGTNRNPESGFVSILDENDKVVSTPGGTAPLYIEGALQEQKQDGKIFMHPHDVCVDDEGNLYVPQWNSHNTYPIKLERIN